MKSFCPIFKTSPEIYKTRAAQNRDIVAFLEASVKNTVESYQNFITKYPDAVQKNDAIKSRNSLAFQIAKSIDKIESYKDFINKYSEANELNEAWNRVYELAYAVAEGENTLQSYKKFVADYPKSSQYAIAMSKINEMNFAIAEKENNAAAYKKFIDENPNSKQYEKAFKLFEDKQYQEYKVEGDYNSLINFIRKCPANSWKAVAMDSIQAIGFRTEALEAHEILYRQSERALDETTRCCSITTCLPTTERSKHSICFTKTTNDSILNDIRKKDYELAELGNKLPLEMIYKPADFPDL